MYTNFAAYATNSHTDVMEDICKFVLFLGLSVVTLVLYVVGFVTDHWSDEVVTKGHQGLWQGCHPISSGPTSDYTPKLQCISLPLGEGKWDVRRAYVSLFIS